MLSFVSTLCLHCVQKKTHSRFSEHSVRRSNYNITASSGISASYRWQAHMYMCVFSKIIRRNLTRKKLPWLLSLHHCCLLQRRDIIVCLNCSYIRGVMVSAAIDGGKLMGYFNLPWFAWGSAEMNLGDTLEYNTLVRVTSPYDRLATAIIKLFVHYNIFIFIHHNGRNMQCMVNLLLLLLCYAAGPKLV